MDLAAKALASGAAFLLAVFVADVLDGRYRDDGESWHDLGTALFGAALFFFITGAIWL